MLDKHMMQRDLEKSTKPSRSIEEAKYWNNKIFKEAEAKNKQEAESRKRKSDDAIRDVTERGAHRLHDNTHKKYY